MNLKTRLRSAGMRYFSSSGYQEKQRAKARRQREKQGAPPVVHYFHQVDDPYSHLAVQKLDALKATYQLDFAPHLVSKPGADYRGSAQHFDQWALNDAVSVATDYGTEFSPRTEAPGSEAVAAANGVLAAKLEQDDFARSATQIGHALWSKQPIAADPREQATEREIAKGDALREALGHYQGGMFHFDGEWYWGIDRLRLLEERLIEEGFANNGEPSSPCVPEPTARDTSGANAQQIVLDYFPSLRSPYTAVGHARVLDLIARSGVRVNVRPVMPMLMRGVPAPRAKQRYIITDAGREARAHGVPFGRIVDPFGEPVRRAFALLPGAQALGGDMAFVTAYLAAAWHDGIDITTEGGLRRVVEMAGLDWAELQAVTRGADWEAALAKNLEDMLALNLWGVPSFSVSGGNDNVPFACWGQDRIWRVENEIAKRL